MKRHLRILLCGLSIVLLIITCAKQEEVKSSGFVIVDGIKLPYFIEGKGIPCIVVGDGLFPSRALSDNLKEHFRFIFLYARMLVPFDKPVEINKITLDTLVDDIEQVRKKLDLNEFCVFGHSISGLLALEYARKYPKYVTHVIMNGTPPYWNAEARKTQREFWESHASDERKMILEQNEKKLTKEILRSMSNNEARKMRFFAGTPRRFYDPRYDWSWMIEGYYWNAEVWNHLFNVIMPNYDITQGNQITAPIFLSLGLHDYIVPYVLWDDVKDIFPNLSYHLFEKSGHVAMLEEQELFDKMLIEWISSY